MAVKKRTDKKGSTAPTGRRPAAASSGHQLRIKLIRSLIGHPVRHREVVKGLGLGKVHSEVVRPDRPEVRGMVRKVAHLVKVEVVESK